MNFLKKLDKCFEIIANVILAVCILLIVTIVCIQVVSRNLFYFDLGVVTNIPVYLMITGTWLGAASVARKKDHIRVALLEQFIKKKIYVKVLNTILDTLVCIASALFTWHGFYYCLHTLHKRGTIDPTLNMPEWMLKLVIPVCMLFFTLYYIKHIIVDFIDLKGDGKK